MWVVIGTIAIVIGTIVGGVFIERRFGPRRLADKRAKELHAPGDAPATAIHGDLAKLRRQTCCKTEMTAEVDRVTYDGRELNVLRFHCTKCDAKRSLYVI